MDTVLKDFGPVFALNVKSRKDRRAHIESEFAKYSVTNYQIHECIDASTSNLLDYIGPYESLPLSAGELACGISHLHAIRDWLATSTTDYAIIVEDDLSLDTVPYWQWDWQGFLNLIEVKYDMLQLAIINLGDINTSIHFREARDWSGACYLITRPWAEKLMEKYFKDGKIHFPVVDREKIVPEGLVFGGAICLSFPLFVANENLGESINKAKAATMHQRSWDQAMEFWKTRPTTLTRKIAK
jgi:hypothetical protein